MKTIDARGQSCPTPVILLKQALKDNNENIRELVDNQLSKENIEKMLIELGLTFNTTKKDSDYIIDIQITDQDMLQLGASIEDFIVVLSSDKMGQGDDEFSLLLMENFLYSLSESDKLPSKIVLYNSGIRLACTNENTIKDLKKLEELGCEILVCGLCLNYYKLTEKLAVGSISNMYKIVETNLNASKVVQP